jgi:hypothetical protein
MEFDFPSPTTYKEQGKNRLQLIQDLRAQREQKIKEEIITMTLDDHILFIKSIINEYVGAELIRIHYDLPHLTEKLMLELSTVLDSYGWNVELSNDYKLEIDNYNENEKRFLPEIFINRSPYGYIKPDFTNIIKESKITRPRLFSLYVSVDLNTSLIKTQYFCLSNTELESMIDLEK